MDRDDNPDDEDLRNGRRLSVAITVVFVTFMAVGAISWALDKGGFYQVFIPFIVLVEAGFLFLTAQLVINEIRDIRGG